MSKRSPYEHGSVASAVDWGNWGADTPRPHLEAVAPADEPEAQDENRSPLNLPAEFWQARPVLTHVRQAAQSRRASPDAVLGALLARTASYVHHGDTMDLIGKGEGFPLTVFAVSYGPPGSGKGRAWRCAAALLPVPAHLTDFRERSLGSGEGLIEAYYGLEADDEDGKTKVRRQVRHNVLFEMDEGEALTKMITGRSGTTIAQMLRSAWSGENIGQANASADRDRQLLRGEYSMGIHLGFQPSSIGPLFDPKQVGGGTPHRFLYLSALDPHAPDEQPDWPGPLDLIPPGQPFTPTSYVLTDLEIRARINAEQAAALRGEAILSEQDTHATQFRGRIAAHLARWDGRRLVNAEDWQLAAAVMTTSAAVRDAAIEYGRTSAAAEATEWNKRMADRAVAVDAAVVKASEQRDLQRISRVAATIARRVAKLDQAQHRDLKDALTKVTRPFLADAVAYAVEAGWIVRADARYVPGPSLGEVPDQ
jgi:hypothetical protein